MNSSNPSLQISPATKEKVDALKAYIERKYSRKIQEEKEKRDAWDQLNKKMESMNLTTTEQENIKRDIIHKESERYRQKRKAITVRDFESIAIIGRGAFGEVRVCRYKETGEIVALKKMNKTEMINKNQLAHVRAEKEVLALASNPWIVGLKFSFQDEKYLYLVMEYLAGGDLMTLLIKKDIFTEEEAKFYIAEAILAVESVHKLNYIHRDLKPDNILLDAKGHIKLSDFGLCKHTEIKPQRFGFRANNQPSQQPETSNSTVNSGNTDSQPRQPYRRNRKLAYSTVGTPDYIAPEVFGQNGYSETVDWWSLGVILFEMLVGYPPFFSDDPSTTCQKILHWRKTLVIPPEANLSPAAVDLLRKMISDANDRLGVNGVEEIKFHPFFAGVDWKKIRDKKAPNIPELASEIDTSNFDKFEEEEPLHTESSGKKRARKDANFIGFTFNREAEKQRSHLVTALQELESNRISQPRQQIVTNTEVETTKTETNTNNTQQGTQAPLSSNIMNAIKSINLMNNSHTNFPLKPNGVSSTQQNKDPGTNSIGSESTNQQPTTTSGYTSGTYSTNLKSPTNVSTTNKEPNKYAQYIPREIPLRSNNLNPTARQDAGNTGYTIESLQKKKEITLATNNPEPTYAMKNKFTPTNNTGGGGISSTTMMSGTGLTSKISLPTTQIKKPGEGITTTTSTKPTINKYGLSQPISSKPTGGK